MKLAGKLSLGALLLLPALAAEKPRVMFGVVPDAALVQDGLAVRAVRPASPAQVAGLQVGDVIVALNGTAVSSKEEMSAVLQRLAPGDVLRVEVLQRGARRVLDVPLVERPVRQQKAAASPDAAVGGDRVLRPLVVDASIRQAMREHRRAIVAQLAALPGGFVPMEVSDHLQAIRHLARDANPRGRGWMLGEAGEVSLQFKDAQGIMVLHGASNQLTLTVYDAAGNETHKWLLNTPEARAEIPQGLIERLQELR